MIKSGEVKRCVWSPKLSIGLAWVIGDVDYVVFW